MSTPNDGGFKLTPKTDEVNQNFASEVLASIQLADKTKARKRPVLIAQSSRRPIGIQRQLQKAAKKHRISMTSIEVEALRRILPSLLTEPEMAPEPGDDEDDE
jgi:hypothetical protein